MHTEHEDDVTRGVAEFSSHARSLSAAQWQTPRDAGKWTPCQEAQHLVLSFQFFALAVRGKLEIALQVSPERSRALYAAVVPKLEAGEALPKGARSPTPADPAQTAHGLPDDRESVLRDLLSVSGSFVDGIAEAKRVEPARQVQHPYFGLLSLNQFEMVAAAHTRHHMGFLPVAD